MNPPTVRTAGRADRAGVVGVLAAAFAADPVVSWMIGPVSSGGDRMTVRRSRRFFAALTSYAQRRGWCDLAVDADGGAIGAAVWYPPAGRPDGLAAAAQLPGLLASVGRRLAEVGQADQLMLSHRPPQAHWYLQFIGVRPDHAGQGVGAALLTHRLAQIDAEGFPAYLESSSPRNARLYARFGFVPTGELSLGPDGPSETLMLRPVRNGAP